MAQIAEISTRKEEDSTRVPPGRPIVNPEKDHSNPYGTGPISEAEADAKFLRSLVKVRERRRNEARLQKALDKDTGIFEGESPQSADTERANIWSTGKRMVVVEEEGTQVSRPGKQERLPPDGSDKVDHLPNEAKSFFNDPVRGPDDGMSTPPWFHEELLKLAKWETATPSKSPVVFNSSWEAATQNSALLKEFGIPNTFSRDVDEDTKLNELRSLILRGNHKSAKEFPDQVQALLDKDVRSGFAFVIPIETLSMIPGAAIQPLGIVTQWTIDEKNNRVPKYWMTQDLSYSSSGTREIQKDPVSINGRIDMGAYAEMIYGWCLPRIIHFIMATRIEFPSVAILISKYDYSDAYRRIAHSGDAAVQTIAIHGELAYLYLRLTFGGSPNPPTWCMISEIVTDLANEIIQCKEWDPKVTFNPAHRDTPETIRLDQGIPFGEGRRMAVDIPISDVKEEVSRVDRFIDDLIHVFVDSPANVRRQPHVVLLTMHVTSRPHAGENVEPIPRRAILSASKLEAEGAPSEYQVVLGWRIDNRRLTISLPKDKYREWINDLKELREHFLSNLRQTIQPRQHRRQAVRLSEEAKEDLGLWETILTKATEGVSLNLISTREPTRICWSDACPVGLGAYSIRGRAWRIKIPIGNQLRGDKRFNNVFEFMGMVINVWLECMDVRTSNGTFPCILAIGDNTSAIGWLFRTSRIENPLLAHNVHNLVARKLAELLLEYKACIASQHLKGELNTVADLLSFAGNADIEKPHPLAHDEPNDDELTDRFLSYLQSQVPRDFAILDLPPEILSWVVQILQTLESFSSCQEGRNEGADRVWRRWEGYCAHIGWDDDHFITTLSIPEQELVVKAFLQMCRTTNWKTDRSVDGTRKKPMVSNTVRQAASYLATAFREHNYASPLHQHGRQNLRPFARSLLKDFDQEDPPKQQQRAATPKLLRAMYTLSGAGLPATANSVAATTAELAIIAFFFAMRSCDITSTAHPGRTKIIRLRGVTFRDKQSQELTHDDAANLKTRKESH